MVEQQGNITRQEFQFAGVHWDHVRTPMVLSLWLLLAILSRMTFHFNKRFSGVFPDSALLIVVGIIAGLILQALGVESSVFLLHSHAFFLYLLPPIMLEAGYFMPNRALFENFWPIFSFALVGTCFNAIVIGISLLLLSSQFSVAFTPIQLFLFSSLISAVDPVAIIAFFEQIHVNVFLYVSVMGEALFNDSVVVMLYQMFKKFIAMGEDTLLLHHYFLGVASLVLIACGGAALGIFFGLASGFMTKYTTRCENVNPVITFLLPYLCYITAELFGVSSIISTAVCGMVMKQYVKDNVPHSTQIGVSYFVKAVSEASNAVVYFFLGLSTISYNNHWDWYFIGYTVLFCTIYRIIAVAVQCFIFNKFHHTPFTTADQIILAFGGLRGAIAYGLVLDIDDSVPAKNMFATTTLVVIFVTVFIQGIAIQPLIKVLGIKLEDHSKKKVIESVQDKTNCYTTAAVENIAGQNGVNSFINKWETFNASYIRPWVIRNERGRRHDASRVVRAFTKITVEEAMNEIPSVTIKKNIKEECIEHLKNASSEEISMCLDILKRRERAQE